MSEQAFIFEIQQVGKIARVSAIDPVTLTEVVLQAPAKTNRLYLQRAAAQKLLRALARRAEKIAQEEAKTNRKKRLF